MRRIGPRATEGRKDPRQPISPPARPRSDRGWTSCTRPCSSRSSNSRRRSSASATPPTSSWPVNAPAEPPHHAGGFADSPPSFNRAAFCPGASTAATEYECAGKPALLFNLVFNLTLLVQVMMINVYLTNVGAHYPHCGRAWPRSHHSRRLAISAVVAHTTAVSRADDDDDDDLLPRAAPPPAMSSP